MGSGKNRPPEEQRAELLSSPRPVVDENWSADRIGDLAASHEVSLSQWPMVAKSCFHLSPYEVYLHPPTQEK